MLRLDNVQFASLLPNYINIVPNPTGNISISGTVTAGNTVNFPVTVANSSLATRSDVYAIGNNLKQLISTSNYISNDVAPGGGVYKHISTELAQLAMTITSGSITVTISIFNGTGSNITLVTQTIQIEVVPYQIPF